MDKKPNFDSYKEDLKNIIGSKRFLKEHIMAGRLHAILSIHPFEVRKRLVAAVCNGSKIKVYPEVWHTKQDDEMFPKLDLSDIEVDVNRFSSIIKSLNQ